MVDELMSNEKKIPTLCLLDACCCRCVWTATCDNDANTRWFWDVRDDYRNKTRQNLSMIFYWRLA